MAKQFQRIDPAHAAFIQRQPIFFTAPAAATGRVNVSPRGTDALRAGPQHCRLPGRPAAATRLLLICADGRLTIMFCALGGAPMILRLYGRGKILPRGSPGYGSRLKVVFDNQEASRHIVRLEVDLIQTSCGYGVLLFDKDRTTLRRWAEAKGPAGCTRTARKKRRQHRWLSDGSAGRGRLAR